MLCFGCEPADEGDPRYIRRRDRRPSSHQRCRQLSVVRGPPGGHHLLHKPGECGGVSRSADRRLRCLSARLEGTPLMPEQAKTVSPREIALLALLGLLWGMPYALTKIALATIPPVTLVAARVALAAAVLWIIVLFMGCKIPARRDFVGGLFVQGCVGCAIPYGLIAIGQQSVDSALAAILNSTTPIFVFLISLAWTRQEPLTAGRLFGVTTGLGG